MNTSWNVLNTYIAVSLLGDTTTYLKKYISKPQLHIHDFGHGRATIHPDLSSRDASAWVVAAP